MSYRRKRPQTKIEWAWEGVELLESAEIALLEASADLGTPEPIDTARTLTKVAAENLRQWLMTNHPRGR